MYVCTARSNCIFYFSLFLYYHDGWMDHRYKTTKQKLMQRIVRSSQCILTKPKGKKFGGNENYSRAEEASQAMFIG